MCYVGCDSIWRPKNGGGGGGGGYTYFALSDAHCSKLMLDYFGMLNMYINHAIVVIWVLLRTNFIFRICFIVLACGSLKLKYITSIIIVFDDRGF